MIIGITGTNGSGKGTVVEYLVQKGFKHYSVRSELLAELERRGLPTDRPHLGALGDELRKTNGPGYFIRLFKTQSEKERCVDIAIDSLRSVGEAEALKAMGGILLGVDADPRVRYDRVVVRGSSTDKVDFDTWKKQEEHEWYNPDPHAMNVPAVIVMADYTIQNNGTLEELHQQVDAILKQIKSA